MPGPLLDSLERDVVESVLQMGDGYVLDFSDRTFSEFFEDFGVPIDAQLYRADGNSKAKRLRAFLRIAQPDMVGRVLSRLLDRRLLKRPDGLTPQELEGYRRLLVRLGATPVVTPVTGSTTTEDVLLRTEFHADSLMKLPLDAALATMLVSRMEEAQRCIDAEAYLSAVILCGSVLEGLCLGIGAQDPETVNRTYAAQYKKKVPQFHEWKLREWIEILGKLQQLSPNVEKFGHALRDFRNYVHPAEQVANKFAPNSHTARISFHVVVAAIDDLLRASRGA